MSTITQELARQFDGDHQLPFAKGVYLTLEDKDLGFTVKSLAEAITKDRIKLLGKGLDPESPAMEKLAKGTSASKVGQYRNSYSNLVTWALPEESFPLSKTLEVSTPGSAACRKLVTERIEALTSKQATQARKETIIREVIAGATRKTSAPSVLTVAAVIKFLGRVTAESWSQDDRAVILDAMEEATGHLAAETELEVTALLERIAETVDAVADETVDA